MEYQKQQNRDKVKFVVLIAVVLVIAVFVVSVLLSKPAGKPADSTATPETTAEAPNGTFLILDKELEAAICEQLGIAQVTQQDVESLTVLDCGERTITALTGLEFATGLKELTAKVDVSTFQPLWGLALDRLTLSCEYSLQTQLEDLSKIKRLKALDLTDCGISSVGYLSELPQLEELVLDQNKIFYLSYFNGMSGLKKLSLRGCSIDSIAEMAGNAGIRQIDLRDNEITDLYVLETFFSLEQAETAGNPPQEENVE